MLITKELTIFNKIIPIENISKNSHKLVDVKCDNCGKEKKITYQSYNLYTNNNTEKYYCNNKECINKKRKIAIQEKYNVDNISQIESVKLKKIQTSLDNFGVEYPIQSNQIKEKIKSSNNDKYGTDWITQTDIFKEKSKIKNLEKYGAEYATQSEEVKIKIKNTCLNKYGIDSYIKTNEFKEKSKIKNLEKYGAEHPMESEEIKEKVKKTINIKYGVDYASQLGEIKEKIKKYYNNLSTTEYEKIKNKNKNTCLEKYGTEYYSQSDFYKNIVKNRKIELLKNKYNLNILDIKDNIIKSKCNNCNSYFEANYQLLYNRYVYNIQLCTKCNPIDSLSASEIEIQKFIIENFNYEILLNNREIIKPYELDVYIPELKLAFEYNGLYWHNELHKEKKYHYDKTEKCEKLGIIATI